jgi:hypothetical protein
MAHGILIAQTTREAPSTPMSETFLAPKMLPVCCVCGLIRDETASFIDCERWVRPRTYRTTHGVNPDNFPLTHTYCPTCFTKVMGKVRQYLRKSRRFSPIPRTPHHAQEGTMKYEPTQIISRIKWCRRQQQLPSVTPDERAGWRAEEAGLVDALGHRDQTAFMRGEHQSHFTRYQCGLTDGQALLRLCTSTPSGMTHLEGWRPAPLTTTARMDSRRSQVFRPAHAESRR